MRIKDPALLALLKYEHDECELSGETWLLHLHHVIFKSHQGDDLRSNILCMVDDLHRRYHAGDPEVMLMVANHVNDSRPDIAGYISDKLGGPDHLLLWFERHGLG